MEFLQVPYPESWPHPAGGHWLFGLRRRVGSFGVFVGLRTFRLAGFYFMPFHFRVSMSCVLYLYPCNCSSVCVCVC